jgi:hypothetical protein
LASESEKINKSDNDYLRRDQLLGVTGCSCNPSMWQFGTEDFQLKATIDCAVRFSILPKQSPWEMGDKQYAVQEKKQYS